VNSKLLSNRTSRNRAIATFAVVFAVIGLGGGLALGATNKETVKLDRVAQVAKPQQRQQTTGTISSGFNPQINGFSFANFTDNPNNTAVGIEDLITVFGQTSVCAQVTEGTCAPYKSATDFITKLRVELAKGRCDGLVVLASRLFQKQSSLTNFSSNATTTAQLTVSQVDNEVVYWWTTQILPGFTKASTETLALQPSQFADRIAQDIRSGAGSTIGIYTNEIGHSVLPIAIRFNGSLAEIDIYDSNTPGLTQRLTINRDLESWAYVVSNASGLETQTVSGNGSGRLALVAMNARQSTPTKYFANLDGATTSK